MFWRKKTHKPPDLTEILNQLHLHTLALKQLAERIEAAEGAHERLRGRFYATKGHDSPREPQTKAEILRDYGYMPGRPTPHS